jgi:hypothetical protein
VKQLTRKRRQPAEHSTFFYLLVTLFAYSVTLMMETVFSFETSTVHIASHLTVYTLECNALLDSIKSKEFLK